MPKMPKSSKNKHSRVDGLSPNAAVREIPITNTLKDNYMPYAMSVIVSRAIPEIDGLKPAHRKLLYTMYKMGLQTGNRTKSANVVGQTMRLNPHGDAAIYETLVRLTRGNGALLHPLIDSKGNFGKVTSRDMAYAASRYTEVKLEKICEELFGEIDRETVDFNDNYDNTMKEPALLPTTFPNLLVAQNQGIAVGMASQLCGFNLGEVCKTAEVLLDNPQADLFATLPAPDFPTGGELLHNTAELQKIYETGRGSFRVRSRWRFDKKENVIEVYEIPYSTTAEAILDAVGKLIKEGKLKDVADMRDESDLSGLKLTIDLKRGTDPDALMVRLMQKTPLCDTFSCNFNVLIGGTPKVLGLRELFAEWTAWRRDCVRRRIYFDVGKLKDKLHLLYALQKVLLDIDRAIRVIRETEEESEVIPELMIAFGIDEVQASHIADIRLRNLNKEYILKKLAEIGALEAARDEGEADLRSSARLDAHIRRDLRRVAKQYAAPRRTLLIYDHVDAPVEEQIPDDPMHIFLSQEGYFKKIPEKSLRSASDHKYKEGDDGYLEWYAPNTAEILFFSDQCLCYKARLCDFEETKASALGTFVPTKLGFASGERVVFAVCAAAGRQDAAAEQSADRPSPSVAADDCMVRDRTIATNDILFLFQNGKIARVNLSAYETVTNRKRLTGAYSDKSPLAAARHLTAEEELAVTSSDNRCVVFHTAALNPKTTRNTQGVAVLSLKKNAVAARLEPAETVPDAVRYRVRNLPSPGKGRTDGQMTMEGADRT